ncbi:YceI family protein [Corynebacterium sp.]|uniref:YceI family protein n=1 Tax=Corynebacterium sp. TaxID=1720 RepID=UPI0026DAC268|nr:YceI family protein [Corynebacterium sp.]MDO5032204.1 YceI family protein [Corynebacterium sp.]
MTNLAGTYTIDPAHTLIGFVARHAMVTKVRGRFDEFEGALTVGENPAESSAEATIKTSSIDTGDTKRDEHVRGDDFFSTEQFPEMTFKATSFDVDAEGNGTVTGDLTIKGTTKPVTLKVETEGIAEDPFGNTRLGFEASTKINRTDFGIDFNAPLKTGGMLVSEEIKIEIEASAIKQ